MISRPRLNPSVLRWMLAFLALDALVFAYLLGSCAFYRNDCVDVFTFIPSVYYVPVSMAIMAYWTRDVFPLSASELAALLASGLAFHALVGAGIGWLLRNRRVPFFVALAVAALVIATILAATWFVAAGVVL